MPATIPEFWQLLADSRLVTAEQYQQLRASFGQAQLFGDHLRLDRLVIRRVDEAENQFLQIGGFSFAHARDYS